jgi:uncharacterized membrane protein
MSRISLLRLPVLLALPLLAACTGEGADGNLPGGDDTQPFNGIAADERLHFTGTEPFWGGEVEGETLVYSTPDNPEGQSIEVSRFAGRGGLSYSGTIDGRSFDMAVTPAECSDGMSDRTYPFVLTLQIGEEAREGCGWTESQPFTGPEQP